MLVCVSLRACAGLSCAFCGEIAFDFTTAAISIADIVADVAVAAEFHRAGQHELFTLSCTIFGLAQFCYAFLFVATYGAHLSNRGKMCAFFVALPFSQLVPVFTLVESFHLPCIGLCLRMVGLRPTVPAEASLENSDSLWALLQRKFHAHAGFLVEALVEAIPQCALQVSAVVLTGDASFLNVFSILLSLAVICSKGWLAAYSLHRPTFVFNSLAIAADVACLFASFSWLESSLWTALAADVGGTALANATNAAHAAHAAHGMSLLWARLVVLGTALGAVCSAGVILFSIADDHLKVKVTQTQTPGSMSTPSEYVHAYAMCMWHVYR